MLEEGPDRVVEFLTGYSNGIALQALDKAREIQANLFTRIALINNPQISAAYEYPIRWKAN